MEQIFSLAQKTSWRIEMKTLRPWRKSTLQACSENLSSSYSFVQMPFRWSLSSTGGDSWWRRVKVSPTPHNVWRRKEKENKVGKKRSSKECFTKWAAMGLTTRLKLCRWTFWSKVLDEWNPSFMGSHLWPCIENSYKLELESRIFESLLQRRMLKAPYVAFIRLLHSKCCCWCFRWIALALVVILRCVWTLWDFSFKSYEHFKSITFLEAIIVTLGETFWLKI